MVRVPGGRGRGRAAGGAVRRAWAGGRSRAACLAFPAGGRPCVGHRVDARACRAEVLVPGLVRARVRERARWPGLVPARVREWVRSVRGGQPEGRYRDAPAASGRRRWYGPHGGRLFPWAEGHRAGVHRVFRLPVVGPGEPRSPPVRRPVTDRSAERRCAEPLPGLICRSAGRRCGRPRRGPAGWSAGPWWAEPRRLDPGSTRVWACDRLVLVPVVLSAAGPCRQLRSP